MKWLSFLLFSLIGLVALFVVPSLSLSAEVAELESIDFSKQSDTIEKISLKFDSLVSPRIFILKGEKPRLVIDITDSLYKGVSPVELAEGVLATSVRIGLHNEPVKKTRVVVDLSKSVEVEYSHEFDPESNTFNVVMNAGAPIPAPDVKAEVMPATEKQLLVETPVEQKPIPPADTIKGIEITAAKKEVAAEENTENTENTEKKSRQVTSTPTLLDISFDGSSNRGEMVLFHLNDFYPPTVSAIEKDNPRVLCDFMDMELGKEVKESIETKGTYVERIRAARHENPGKVRVVLDLLPNRDYDLQQVFFKNDNLFVLIINELSTEQVEQ